MADWALSYMTLFMQNKSINAALLLCNNYENFLLFIERRKVTVYDYLPFSSLSIDEGEVNSLSLLTHILLMRGLEHIEQHSWKSMVFFCSFYIYRSFCIYKRKLLYAYFCLKKRRTATNYSLHLTPFFRMQIWTIHFPVLLAACIASSLKLELLRLQQLLPLQVIFIALLLAIVTVSSVVIWISHNNSRK